MSTETKPVETKLDEAGTQAGVETKHPEAPKDEVDFLGEYEKVLADNKRLQEERDNYKRIGLRRKKGEDADETVLTEEEVERRAEVRAQELIQKRQLEENERKAQEIALKALKENRELKIALKNRNGVVTTASTAGGEEGKDKKVETFFTTEQIAALKKRGIDPEKVKENYRKL